MSESFGGRTRRGFGYLAALRLVGLVLQVLILRFVGKALSGQELSIFLVGVALLAWSGMLGTAGFLPPLLRRMAQDSQILAASIGPARKRAGIAALFFLALALPLGTPLWPALCLAALHFLLPLHLAAAPELLLGRTRLLAHAELLGRFLCLLAFGVLAWADPAPAAQAWPWLILWWMAALSPPLFLWLALPSEARWAFCRRQARAPRPAKSHAESVVALGDFLRSGWFHGIHPVLRALVGSIGYQGFGTAFTLHRVGTTLPSALATTVQGPLSRGSDTDQRQRLLRILPAWLGLGALGALVGVLLAEPILHFLFPNLSPASGTQALSSLRLLMASWPALFGAGLCLPFLLARGRETQVAWLSATALLLCFTVLFSLLPILGPVAAAWALLATEVFVFVSSFTLVLTPR